MPAKSKAQFRAMAAAAHGKSNLGIPKKVGEEFMGATKGYRALPERKRHLSKHNANVTLRVSGHQEGEDGQIRVRLTDEPPPKRKEGHSSNCSCCCGPMGSTVMPWLRVSNAELVLSKAEAQAYPVGSKVVLHCVPAGEEKEAESAEEAGSEYRAGESRESRKHRMAESMNAMAAESED